jgi:hypothetical protein
MEGLNAVRRMATATGSRAACAAVHGGALAFSEVTQLAASAYLPAVGYLIGAAGAFIGPRYVPVNRPL